MEQILKVLKKTELNKKTKEDVFLSKNNPPGLANINFEIETREIKRIVKKEGFLPLLLLLNSLNLQPNSLYQALKDKKIFNILLSEIRELTNQIKSAKDWRSKSYLMDKLTEREKSKTPGNLVGLQIIVGDGNQSTKDTVGGEEK